MNVKDAGLKRDANDERQFRHDRNEHIGFTYQNEWHQNKPFFFTREANVNYGFVGNYRGAKAFLICGGPSFKGIDKRKLKYSWTMSVNNSIKSYRTDAWVCVDDPSRFLASCWLDPKIMKFVPYDAAEKSLWDSRYLDDKQMWGPLGLNVGDCPNVHYFRRNAKFNADRWLWESTLNWGNTKNFGGCRSVMLPALRILFLLGFRHVYLLGCDLNMTEDNRYHFDDGRKKEALQCNATTYKKMIKEYFPLLKKEFDKYGFNVYNCNPQSKLEVFPYVEFREATSNSVQHFGDLRYEKTEGMYRTYRDKVRALQEDLKKIDETQIKK